jgi:hypothetical protein
VYARTFESFRVFYSENESLDLDALRDQDHGTVATLFIIVTNIIYSMNLPGNRENGLAKALLFSI